MIYMFVEIVFILIALVIVVVLMVIMLSKKPPQLDGEGPHRVAVLSDELGSVHIFLGDIALQLETPFS